MKHSFELKSKDQTKPTALLYKCYLNGTRFTYGVGLNIFPELWDESTQRPTRSKPIIKDYKQEIPDIETKINNVRTRIENICIGVEMFISNAQIQNTEIQLSDLRQYLDAKVGNSRKIIEDRPKLNINGTQGIPVQGLNLIQTYAEKFIQEIKNGKRTIRSGSQSNKRYTPQTIKNYTSFLNQWIKFEKTQKHKYSWEEMGLNFYNAVLHYFNARKYKWDTVGKMIKHLKVIAQAAMDDGIHTNLEFRKQYFKALKSEIENIALTFEEVEKLEKLDLSKHPAWDKARDVFLMGCYTALRFSDLKRLRKIHFRETVIAIITQKTKIEVIIPIKSEMMEIIKKYDYQAPKLSEQKVNEYIKQISQLAGIDSPIEKKEIIGGETKIRTVSKFELITTHTARRTAATHMYLRNMLPIDIMKITGHKTESSFLKYICVPKEESVKRMAENEFFK